MARAGLLFCSLLAFLHSLIFSPQLVQNSASHRKCEVIGAENKLESIMQTNRKTAKNQNISVGVILLRITNYSDGFSCLSALRTAPHQRMLSL